MARIKKLTPKMLKRMVLRERRRMMEVLETGQDSTEAVAKKTDEVEAPDLASSIENDVDWMKALKIKEAHLKRNLLKINGVKRRIKRRIIKKLS